MNPKLSLTLKRLCLTAFAFILALGLAEIALRVMNTYSSKGKRFLAFSSPHFTLARNKAVKYLPDQRIRSVTVYNGKIEYDVTYHTNNWGYIDHRNYPLPDRGKRIVLLGDSFAAGIHGGTPWAPALGEKLHQKYGIALYCLGVSGTGVENFARILELEFKRINPTMIVIIAPGDDMRRPAFYPLANNNTIRFCLEKYSKDYALKYVRPIARIIPFSADQAGILAMAANWPPTVEYEAQGGMIRKMLAQTELYQLAKRLRYRKSTKNIIRYTPTSNNVRGLAEISRIAGKIKVHFIHVPTKSELVKYHYDLRTIVEKHGIIYHSARQMDSWKLTMFHTHDAHPNAAGYRLLADIVMRIIIGANVYKDNRVK